jgi:hypothetical protein
LKQVAALETVDVIISPAHFESPLPRCATRAPTAPKLIIINAPHPKKQKRLLCVEHVEENEKQVLYLVFEYLTTDLKRYMDRRAEAGIRRAFALEHSLHHSPKQ